MKTQSVTGLKITADAPEIEAIVETEHVAGKPPVSRFFECVRAADGSVKAGKEIKVGAPPTADKE